MPAVKRSSVLASGGRNQVAATPGSARRATVAGSGAAAAGSSPVAAGTKSQAQPKASGRAARPAGTDPAFAAGKQTEDAVIAMRQAQAAAAAAPSGPKPIQDAAFAAPKQTEDTPAVAVRPPVSPQPTDFSRKRDRADPADMRAAGVVANATLTKFNESAGVVATMTGENSYKNTAISVSREAYKKLDGKPSEPFKPRASTMKDPIAHTDATINNPNFNAVERKKLETERLRSESSRYFVDHYALHGDQVKAGKAVRPAAILASQQVRASGPFQGTTMSQDSFIAFKNDDGTPLQPAKPFKPAPQKLELVKEDRDFQSEQRKQQAKTMEMAQTMGSVNILVKNSVSLKNFRGNGAAAAMGFGSSMQESKTVSQAAFSKFSKQQQINAKAREPTTISSPVKQVQPIKARAAAHARDTNQGPNTEFTHVAHRDDTVLPGAAAAAAAAAAAPAAATPVVPPLSAKAAAAAIQSPPRAGMSSARGKAIDAGTAPAPAGPRHTNLSVQSKAGYNIISSLNQNETKKWNQNNPEASTAASSFVHDGTGVASKSFKPVNANASSAAINGSLDHKEHGSAQWASEGKRAFAGQQNTSGTGVLSRGAQQLSSGGVVQTPFEGRSTAADSYSARPKAAVSPKKK